MPNNNGDLEKKLWSAADNLRANSKLNSYEYSTPVLGLIFLRFADHKFTIAEQEVKDRDPNSRKSFGKTDYQARNVLYLPEVSRFKYLLNLPEGTDYGKAINQAMEGIESENEELKDVLPKTYNRLENDTLISLLKTFASIPMDVEGDVFGKIYEYFLGEFAKGEGQKGGEFFTPTSLVKLIVEIIEPYHGRIYDPACGSGGMFVQSAKFVENHHKNPNSEIMVYGQEKSAQTVRLAKMNMAVHGLSGDIRQGNTFYEDRHNCLGKFDFVMANPPFNVNGVDKEKIKNDRRYELGVPSNDNANYLWIDNFFSALKPTGRAGFVMSAAAGDAGNSELEIRKRIIQTGAVDVMVAIGPKFFYTVTLPCALWFFDKGKVNTDRKDKILFIDAREIFKQVDKAHREFTPEQIEFIANITNLYRGEAPEFSISQETEFRQKFPDLKYQDVAGLCKIATIKEVEEQGWSLNPGRYVGTNQNAMEKSEETPTKLFEEYKNLCEESMKLEKIIIENFDQLHNK
jgi:type I restriction enzyme M protein